MSYLLKFHKYDDTVLSVGDIVEVNVKQGDGRGSVNVILEVIQVDHGGYVGDVKGYKEHCALGWVNKTDMMRFTIENVSKVHFCHEKFKR